MTCLSDERDGHVKAHNIIIVEKMQLLVVAEDTWHMIRMDMSQYSVQIEKAERRTYRVRDIHPLSHPL